MPTFITLLLEHEHVEERGHLVSLVLLHALLQLHALVTRHDRHLADALKTHTNRVLPADSRKQRADTCYSIAVVWCVTVTPSV